MRGALLVAALTVTLGCGRRAGRDEPPAQVTIELRRDGASPASIEAEVIVPIEDALAPIPGVAHLRATAEDGRARLSLELAPRADPAAVLAAVRDRLQAMLPTLPADASFPVVSLVPARASRRLFQVLVEPDAPFPSGDRYRLQRARLETQRGVHRVTACGVAEEVITVTLDADRMAALGISLDIVLAALQTASADAAGYLTRPGAGPSDLAAIPLGDLIRLSDLAQISHDHRRDCQLLANPPMQIVETVIVEANRPLDLGADRVDLATGPVIEGWLALPGSTDEIAALLDRLSDRVAYLPAIHALIFEVPSSDGRALATTRVRLLAVLAADVAPAAVAAIAAELDALARAIPGLPPLRLQARGIVEVEVLLTGADLTALTDTARRLTDDLLATGATAGCDACPTRATAELVVDRDRLAALGLTVAQVHQALALSGPGLTVGTWQDRGRLLPIRLVQPAPPRDLVAATGERVPLTAVTELRVASGPSQILREERQRALRIWVRAAPGTDRSALSRTVTTAITALGAPAAGITIAAPSTPAADPW